jgi:hypothetical protein
MVLTPQMEKLLAEAPPLTARQRDLIAACFAGVDMGTEALAEEPGRLDSPNG